MEMSQMAARMNWGDRLFFLFIIAVHHNIFRCDKTMGSVLHFIDSNRSCAALLSIICGMSDVPSSICCWAIAVSPPKLSISIILSLASGISPAWLKCWMFWLSINRSISSPSVTEFYSSSSLAVSNRTRILVIPQLPFFFTFGRDYIIQVVSSFCLNIFWVFSAPPNFFLSIAISACS